MQIVWFKRDLRVTDHLPVSSAALHGDTLLLYILEPDLWRQPDMSHRHYAYLVRCLTELRQQVQSLGSEICIRVGTAVDVLRSIHDQHPVRALWSHQESGNEWTFERDKQVLAWTRQNGIVWHEPTQFGVHRRLADRDGWARRWEMMMGDTVIPAPRQIIGPTLTSNPLPTAEQLGLAPDGLVEGQMGGRADALDTLNSFLTERGEPYRKGMSSPLSAATACSRLSTHLAFGSLSLREITQATRERQRHLKTVANPGKWRAALSSFSGRLHWHCHFIQKLEDFPAMERLALHPGCRDMPFVEHGAKRKAWETGTTGLPFVDACMRSLIATGWINFRMRAMLTAVASYHLNLPWQRTGHHLARMFTDYEPGIHWPQIQMQSGLTGINTIRIYNPVKQGHDQDPDGTFVRRWVPELSSVPDEFIHEPWKYSNAHTPIIDHMNAAREARVRVYDARKGSAFKEAADKIQHKHGSRRSGLSPMRRRAKQPDTRQGSLDL